MSQYVDTNEKTFVAGAAIAKGLRVKLSAGKLAAAGIADDWIGTMVNASFADGDVVAVRLRTANGTTKFVAAGAVTAGARVYAAASGKVDDTISTELIGIALEAAGADGDFFEVMQLPGGQAYRIARGTATLDGSNPTTVATGLNTIVAAVVSLKAASTPGDDPSWVSASYSGSDGNLDIYAYKNTGGTDPTLVASTNNSATFDWIAIGT